MPNHEENQRILEQRLATWWSDLDRQISFCRISPIQVDSAKIGVVMPGSFNPLHPAHLAMARQAESILGAACIFELSVSNVDKGNLEIFEVRQRLNQDFGQHGVMLSNAARFTQKSNIYPGATLVVGADTMIRLSDASYYNNDPAELDNAIKQILNNGCRFLVFGRMIGNKFIDSKNIQISDRLRKNCQFVDQGEFEMNISSTILRESEKD